MEKTRIPYTRLILWVVAAVVLGFPVSLTTARSSSQPKPKASAAPRDANVPLVKYRAVTKEQAAANRKQAIEMAEKAHTFAPNMHLVETAHFLIFTEWDRGNDRSLAEICERMHQALSYQFDIPPKQNIWAGKCPIFIFWETRHYVVFTKAVDRSDCEKAGGYHVQNPGGFCYIVMNRCEKRKRFFELLIHEATHAFLGRYLTNRPLSRWVNEGLAEYMAAMLVPGGRAKKEYKVATKTALRENRDVRYIFKDVALTSFDYGIAQSLVRFMIAHDRRKFVRFVELLKEGKNEAEALRLSYDVTHQQLLRTWAEAVAEIHNRRR